MRRFELHRHEDVAGISGTGVVAQGCEFDDGTAVVRWLVTAGGIEPTTVIHPNLLNVVHLHSHAGRSQIVYIDEAEPLVPEPRRIGEPVRNPAAHDRPANSPME